MDDCSDPVQSFAVMSMLWWTCQKNLSHWKWYSAGYSFTVSFFNTLGSEMWFVVVQSCLGQWIIMVTRCLRRDFNIKGFEWVPTHMHSLCTNRLFMLSHTVTSSPSWHADMIYRKQVPSTDCLFLCLALKAVIGGSGLGICGRNHLQSKEPIYF